MNIPQGLTTHPEIGPQGSVGQIGSSVGVTTGEIRFSQSPSPSTNPMSVVDQAIASGDTVESRIDEFNAAMRPPEQK